MMERTLRQKIKDGALLTFIAVGLLAFMAIIIGAALFELLKFAAVFKFVFFW
jgi:hypothetical protein